MLKNVEQFPYFLMSDSPHSAAVVYHRIKKKINLNGFQFMFKLYLYKVSHIITMCKNCLTFTAMKMTYKLMSKC